MANEDFQIRIPEPKIEETSSSEPLRINRMDYWEEVMKWEPLAEEAPRGNVYTQEAARVVADGLSALKDHVSVTHPDFAGHIERLADDLVVNELTDAASAEEEAAHDAHIMSILGARMMLMYKDNLELYNIDTQSDEE